MKRLSLLIIPLLIVVLILEAINIFLSNQVSTESVAVATLNRELEQVEEKNYILRGEVLRYSSIERVSSRAAELGFVDPTAKQVISLNEPLKVAIR